MADSVSSPDKNKKHTHHHRGESHGMRDDIDETTPINEVKGPNVFERAKEEVEALVEAFHSKKEHKNDDSSYVVNGDSIKAESNSGKSEAHSEVISKQHAHHHHSESHGLRDDLDEETPINDVKAPNVFERAKEEFEAIGEAIGEAIHHKKKSEINESHGLRDDLDEGTPINDVKAPNVFERAKEEFEAIGEAIHHKKKSENSHDSSTSHFENWDSIKKELNSGKSDAGKGKDRKERNFLKKAKEEFKSLVKKAKSPHHHHDNETHGRNDDIDENTPIEEVKGPNVFARAKEEFEAVVGAIHQRKESNDSVVTPKGHKHDD